MTFARARQGRGGTRSRVALVAGAWLACLASLVAPPAKGQTASLLYRPDIVPIPGAPTTKDLSYIRLPDPIPIRPHDLINIKIDEKVTLRNNALAFRRKNTRYDITFDEFVVLLSGLRLRPDQAIRSGRPSIATSSGNNVQSLFQFTRNDRFQSSLQAEVAEIRPNGTLVIEAHGTVAVNNEVNTFKLSGVIAIEDIDPKARQIPSERIANKRVELFQVGPTRDGYRRGFLVRTLDMFLPF